MIGFLVSHPEGITQLSSGPNSTTNALAPAARVATDRDQPPFPTAFKWWKPQAQNGKKKLA